MSRVFFGKTRRVKRVVSVTFVPSFVLLTTGAVNFLASVRRPAGVRTVLPGRSTSRLPVMRLR